MQVQELVGIIPWTFVAQICNLFIQMYLIKRFLFKTGTRDTGKTTRGCRCGNHTGRGDKSESGGNSCRI